MTRSLVLLMLTFLLVLSLPLQAQQRRNTAATRTGPSAVTGKKQDVNESGKKTGNSPAQGAQTEKNKSAGEHMSERQKGNLKQLQSDLSAIQQGSQVTEQQKTNLKNSLMAMAEGATRPNPASVQKLAGDLAEALSDGRLSASEQYKLSEDLESIMNSANIPEAEVEKAIADAQAILLASGVDKAAVQTVAYDMQQIAGEAKKNVQKALKRKQ